MKQYESNITKFYWIRILNSAGFHLVVYTIFLLSKGFTLTQFFLIESAYTVIALFFEIPTGVLSDKFSRKWSLVLSSLIGIPTMITIILSESYIVVLSAMAVAGIASSLTSGTDMAILYDSLKAIGIEDEFKKINGKMRWYSAWSGAIGGVIGGVVSQLDLSYAWWLSFIFGLPLLFLHLSLAEPPIHEKEKKESYLLHLRESLRISFTEDSGFFILYSSGICLFFSLGYWLWQPYLELTGLPVLYFGFFYEAERLLSGFIARQSHLIEEKIGMKYSLLIIPLILSSAFFLESSYVVILGFSFIFLQSVSSGYFLTVTQDYVNSRIPSSKRATVLSIKNMVSSLLFSVFSPIIGYLTDTYSLTLVLFLMGTGLCMVLILFYFSRIQNISEIYDPSLR